MMKQAAIFDMDGLLFDTERLYQESWVEMAKQFGQVLSPDCQRTSGQKREAQAGYFPESSKDARLCSKGLLCI